MSSVSFIHFYDLIPDSFYALLLLDSGVFFISPFSAPGTELHAREKELTTAQGVYLNPGSDSGAFQGLPVCLPTCQRHWRAEKPQGDEFGLMTT